MTNYLRSAWLSSLVLLVSAGCSSSGGGAAAIPTPKPQSSTISGAVVDAFIVNSTVTAYEVSAAGVVGVCVPASGGGCATAVSDANGNYTITITGYTGAVLLEATGGTYTDTVTGQTVPVPSGLTLSVLEPAVTAGS
ncbi:MAG: hypothetical protein KGL92_08275, partial [Gammaproteobacteria bacterium]|nr:hypothetical protein [Gammaproteobacteria bacterium]